MVFLGRNPRILHSQSWDKKKKRTIKYRGSTPRTNRENKSVPQGMGGAHP